MTKIKDFLNKETKMVHVIVSFVLGMFASGFLQALGS